jgi:hypothetical protein
MAADIGPRLSSVWTQRGKSAELVSGLDRRPNLPRLKLDNDVVPIYSTLSLDCQTDQRKKARAVAESSLLTGLFARELGGLITMPSFERGTTRRKR